MKFLKKCKDGGPESKVWAYVLVEIKGLFSIMLLKFEHGSREAYHSHAFNAVSWLLSGRLEEHTLRPGADGWSQDATVYQPSLRPIFTPRERLHQVRSVGRSWALSFRGPWVDKWQEVLDLEFTRPTITLTHGRKVVGS